MIDSEIINGELTGVIEPGSRAHVVLKAATSMLMMKKLTTPHKEDLIVSDAELRTFLRNNEHKVNAKELEVLQKYGLLECSFFVESFRKLEERLAQGITEPPYSQYTKVWRLGVFTTEVLAMLRDGDEAYVYL